MACPLLLSCPPAPPLRIFPSSYIHNSCATTPALAHTPTPPLQSLRARGYGLTVEEENLRLRLEAVARELSQPAAFMGRLHEVSRCFLSCVSSSFRVYFGDVLVVTYFFGLSFLSPILPFQSVDLSCVL
jgi:hypothetical protein